MSPVEARRIREVAEHLSPQVELVVKDLEGSLHPVRLGDAIAALDKGDYEILLECRKCGETTKGGEHEDPGTICGACAS